MGAGEGALVRGGEAVRVARVGGLHRQLGEQPFEVGEPEAAERLGATVGRGVREGNEQVDAV